MATNYQILENQTTNGSSLSFRSARIMHPKDNDKVYLGIYGVLNGATLTLKWLAPDGNYYQTGDVIDGVGLFEIPYSSEFNLRLDITNAGASTNLSATVSNGGSVS